MYRRKRWAQYFVMVKEIGRKIKTARRPRLGTEKKCKVKDMQGTVT